MKVPSRFVRSIRHAGLATMIATASLLQACSSEATTVTEPSYTAASPQSASIELRVSGTVTDDDGSPVAGSRVTVYRWTPTGDPRFTVTDANGYYSLPFVPAGGISALAEKEGYERTWRSESMSRTALAQFDIRIHRIKR